MSVTVTPPSPHPFHNEEKLLQNNYVNETAWEYSERDKTDDH